MRDYLFTCARDRANLSTENAVDTLTGEQLELGADHLCEAIETKEDKQRNKSVMTALREQARKIRPK